ncbi:AAA family ATPase [Lichenibacterium dinghuense]|uniref:AAA family ATPase n=1 Tax=Lichenibacterium dinghuense TaxID=2895977 RepID=UPI001F4814E2|nr:AAA family ATPase [Lichenibacterium sp. 6Y81]
MAKVIYLTGAPASGKSSTTRLLAERVPDLLVWEYGARLTEHVRTRSAAVNDQTDLRSRSAEVVTPDDVVEVDRGLLAFVRAHRGERSILIDSHPVTKEAYGFRITAFPQDRIVELAPDEIWVLHADPLETRRRIGVDAGGRPMVSVEDARRHADLQAAVAATYGVLVGCPVHVFDAAVPRDDLVARLAGRLS